MGVMNWIDGDSDDEESDTLATDGLGFDEDLDDLDGEMGDLDGGGDDNLGGGMDDFDDGMGDFDGEMDEMGDLDGGGGDDFGGGGGDFGGAEVDPDTIAEMEDRISELENQVSSTTSEMNTVREENKQIGETVEELDETVRKLLDIYEMVTRGINPFVDDAREMGGLEGDGAFGLFEMEEETEESLDSEVASADAESFFDEDFGDLDAAEDEAELAAEDELADEERVDPAEALDEDDDDAADGDTGGGASFDDLKSEYEENEGWDEMEEADAAAESADEEAEFDEMQDHVGGDLEGDDADADETEDEEMTAEEKIDDALDGMDAAEEIEADESLFEAEDIDETEDAVEDAGTEATNGTAESTHAHSAADAGDSAAEPGSASRQEAPADTDAYLTELPARYTAESVALEWTRFLVDVGGAIGAARALRQYRSLGWITRNVERTMCEHVRNAATAGETERPEDLRAEHHRESLTYISRLAGDVSEARLLDELSALGGGARGIRR
ncbi:FlaD/FlaE family flagellar protein [Halobellus clavatus]|uniref:Flagellar protein FlaC n=1 Tax=Halobellus clavatus TaxID=660517 RepID=A0A1H3CGV9_9EURY|nr:FlaD/FlaE family flagellar protein [Halobellus clavatus]SDX53138.1 flagellar protein FlaC [Halobellus clavatus]